MAVITIKNETEFEEIVLKAEKPVLVDFWAPWCGPCKMVAPELEAVEEEMSETALVVKINVDENQKLAGKYNVMGIPTLLVFKSGAEVNRLVGFRPRQDLQNALEEAR